MKTSIHIIECITRSRIITIHMTVVWMIAVHLRSFQFRRILLLGNCPSWFPMLRKLLLRIRWQISMMEKLPSSVFYTHPWVVWHCCLIFCWAWLLFVIWSVILIRSWHSCQWGCGKIKFVLPHWRVMDWGYLSSLLSLILFTMLLGFLINSFRDEFLNVVEEGMLENLSCGQSSDRVELQHLLKQIHQLIWGSWNYKLKTNWRFQWQIYSFPFRFLITFWPILHCRTSQNIDNFVQLVQCILSWK